MKNGPAPRRRKLLVAILFVAADLLVSANAAPALDLRRQVSVGGLSLLIPVDYLIGGADRSTFLLAVRWPSLLPAAGDRPAGAASDISIAADAASETAAAPGRFANLADILLIGGDEEQLALSLPDRLENLRRFIGAGPAAGERFGLQLFPRDAALSAGHYDPHLELLAQIRDGKILSIVTCDTGTGLLPARCHDELVFRQARITLGFTATMLPDWRAMEIRAQQLLLSFAEPG